MTTTTCGYGRCLHPTSSQGMRRRTTTTGGVVLPPHVDMVKARTSTTGGVVRQQTGSTCGSPIRTEGLRIEKETTLADVVMDAFARFARSA
jgi:hypothetical protein